MAEQLDLTTPVARASTTSYTLASVLLDVANQRIVATLVGNTGEALSKQYDAFTTPTGATLLHSLNTGNFSVNSLLKAIYQRLSTDGVAVGTVSGTPV